MITCIDGLNLHPDSVHDAAAALDIVTARLLEAGDPRAAFADIYGIVTRSVAAQIRRPDNIFLEPAWISRLAGRFCERYLETLRWCEEDAPQDCGAWRVAYTSTSSRQTPPVQNALLGFSAHINYDLVLGIYATILESGYARDPKMLARFKHDHDQVNTLLRSTVPRALLHLAARHGCALSAFFNDRAPETAIWVAMQLLTNWRERVWSDVLALLSASSASQHRAHLQKIDRRALHIGKLLVLSVPQLSRARARALLPAPAPAPAWA